MPPWVWIAYVALTSFFAYRHLPGLSPAALGQDDLWVAFLVRYASPADLLTYAAPVPMGFVAALQAFHPLIDDPELSLQIVPFSCGLALMPVSGWVTRRLTGRWELGLLAAVLVAIHPYGGLHSVRVKQFTWDALTTLTLLGIGLPQLVPASRDRPWRTAIASAFAVLMSFNAVFAGAVLCHLRVLMVAVERRQAHSVRKAVIAAVAFDAFVVLLFLLRLEHQSAQWVVGYWQRRQGFPLAMPNLTDGIDFAWLMGAIKRAYGLWLPRQWVGLTLLAPLGLVFVLASDRSRWPGLAFAALSVGLPVAGLLLLYPFGGVRTDFYFQPLLAILGAAGIGGLAMLMANAVSRAGLDRSRTETLRTSLTLVVGVVFLISMWPAPATYGRGRVSTEARDLVAFLDATAVPGDVVLLTTYSRWNVGYYTTRPIDVHFGPPEHKLFDFELIDPPSRSTDRIARELAAPDAPDRLVFVAFFWGAERLDRARREFRAAGYRLAAESLAKNRGSTVQRWIRTPPEARSAPARKTDPDRRSSRKSPPTRPRTPASHPQP